MATKHDFHKVIIGRSEEISFVDYGINHIPAKTDTGAYRSAIHASDIELDEQAGVLRFSLLAGHPVCGAMAQRVETKTFKKVMIENSFGHGEERYEVRLRVKLGPKIFTAAFTLANRAKKVYPILMGRKLLNHRFLVDSSESSVNRVELKQRYGIDFPDDEDDGRCAPDIKTILK
jgi:hypothetical protein